MYEANKKKSLQAWPLSFFRCTSPTKHVLCVLLPKKYIYLITYFFNNRCGGPRRSPDNNHRIYCSNWFWTMISWRRERFPFVTPPSLAHKSENPPTPLPPHTPTPQHTQLMTTQPSPCTSWRRQRWRDLFIAIAQHSSTATPHISADSRCLPLRGGRGTHSSRRGTSTHRGTWWQTDSLDRCLAIWLNVPGWW